jgi:hypothetical protein
MNTEKIIQALGLPKDSLVSQRIPKKVLLEQGAPTAADKRHIQNGIEELTWVAALKPNNVGIAPFRDSTREYLEVAVLTAHLHADAKATRLTELIHRAVPYPMVLTVSQNKKGLSLSLAHKRRAQNEGEKTVMDGDMVTVSFAEETGLDREFLETMVLSAQPNQNLFALYQGWIDQVEALMAARITGNYRTLSADSPITRRTLLNDRARLERELMSLRSQAVNEKQMNRRVELNLGIQKIEQRLKEQLTQL